MPKTTKSMVAPGCGRLALELPAYMRVGYPRNTPGGPMTHWPSRISEGSHASRNTHSASLVSKHSMNHSLALKAILRGGLDRRWPPDSKALPPRVKGTSRSSRLASPEHCREDGGGRHKEFSTKACHIIKAQQSNITENDKDCQVTERASELLCY